MSNDAGSAELASKLWESQGYSFGSAVACSNNRTVVREWLLLMPPAPSLRPAITMQSP